MQPSRIDVLLRYDPETAAYEPHVAESLEANDDSTVWTMTLREGVEFSDGTPLDAGAVVASIERYLADEEDFIRDVEAGLAEANAGLLIEHEDAAIYLRSLGTDNPL